MSEVRRSWHGSKRQSKRHLPILSIGKKTMVIHARWVMRRRAKNDRLWDGLSQKRSCRLIHAKLSRRAKITSSRSASPAPPEAERGQHNDPRNCIKTFEGNELSLKDDQTWRLSRSAFSPWLIDGVLAKALNRTANRPLFCTYTFRPVLFSSDGKSYTSSNFTRYTKRGYAHEERFCRACGDHYGSRPL